jgi:hypothetical protein
MKITSNVKLNFTNILNLALKGIYQKIDYILLNYQGFHESNKD